MKLYEIKEFARDETFSFYASTPYEAMARFIQFLSLTDGMAKKAKILEAPTFLYTIIGARTFKVKLD